MKMKTQFTLCIALFLLFFGISVPCHHITNDSISNPDTEISAYGICPPQVDNY